ncbi:hypothetical protein chiPu_0032635, partial [Chiloscyllium punctatum]|nr:hypothetical protein [Chiloscyllium punctatum]
MVATRMDFMMRLQWNCPASTAKPPCRFPPLRARNSLRTGR